MVITCPKPTCRSTRTQEFALPIPTTYDDCADCVRCLDCGLEWATDPAAGGACTTCGGSGDIGGTSRGGRCPCTTTEAGTAFTPGPDDVAGTTYGVGINSLGDDGDEGLIAIGTTELRRALAAINWYARAFLDTEDRDRLRTELAAGERALDVSPTRFTRTDDGGWLAERLPTGESGAVPAIWLVPSFAGAPT